MRPGEGTNWYLALGLYIKSMCPDRPLVVAGGKSGEGGVPLPNWGVALLLLLR